MIEMRRFYIKKGKYGCQNLVAVVASMLKYTYIKFYLTAFGKSHSFNYFKVI